LRILEEQLPDDGTFILGAQTGHVYRVSGGAPLYAGPFTTFGGTSPVVVDQVAIDRAGSGGTWDHLAKPARAGAAVTATLLLG
jgi:hypothetical protein